MVSENIPELVPLLPCKQIDDDDDATSLYDQPSGNCY